MPESPGVVSPTPGLIPATFHPNPLGQPPSPSTLHALIAPFLPHNWASIEPSALTITNPSSSTNTIHIVHHPGSIEPYHIHEPEHLAVIIKLRSPAAASTPDLQAFAHLVPSSQEEAEFCAAYSRTGYGARVIGLFQTLDGTVGRIDEYIDDVRSLEAADIEDETVRTDVARALAEVHALRGGHVLNGEEKVGMFHDALVRGLARFQGMDRLKRLGREGGVDVDDLVDYDLVSGVRMAVDGLERLGAKTGWCVHDVQYGNVLVRNNPKNGESRVALVDFEFVMKNFRGFDIGGHFMQKMFKWFDTESKIVDCRGYVEAERRQFCDEYATRWNKLTGDMDTGQQVLVESEFGYLLAIAFDIHNMLSVMAEEEDKDPLNLLGLNRLFQEFKNQYFRVNTGIR